MNDVVLKLAVATVVTILAGTVKNPKSARARKLRKYVQQAHDATHEFLAATAVEGDEEVR